MRRIQLILDAEKYAKMEYPKVGNPFESVRSTAWKNNPTPPEVGWLPRIDTSTSEGIYDEYFQPSGEDALGESARIVAHLKKCKETLGEI